MNETEPLYIKELRTDLKRHFDNKIENHVPKYFIEFKDHIDKKFDHVDRKFDESKKETRNLVESSINELAIMIKDTVAMKTDLEDLATKAEVEEIRKTMVTKAYVDNALDEIHEKMDTLATKKEVGEILKHIGSYEVRTKNTEDIVTKDHKPRIADLEKEVFA